MGVSARRRAEQCHALPTMIDTYYNVYLKYHSETGDVPDRHSYLQGASI